MSILPISQFKPLSLRWEPGGEQPVVAFDFGPETVGGYAAFDVDSFESAPDGALPVLRLSYACHPDSIRPEGDFTREDHAYYLHVDNPVLPANPGRHELYTIPRTGTFVAPLIQGQLRYLRVAQETPGAAVSLAGLRIANPGVHADTPPRGSFASSDPRMEAIWHLGVRSCQMASLTNPDAWRVVEGALLPRRLERGSAEGWCRFEPDFEGTLELAVEFRRNPHFNGPAFFEVFTGRRDRKTPALRGDDASSSRDGEGAVATPVAAPCEITDAEVRQIVRQQGPDGEIRTVRIPLKPGRFGFRLEKEQWPVIHEVRVLDEKGEERWKDVFGQCSQISNVHKSSVSTNDNVNANARVLPSALRATPLPEGGSSCAKGKAPSGRGLSPEATGGERALRDLPFVDNGEHLEFVNNSPRLCASVLKTRKLGEAVNWVYPTALPYLADGGKRDRLVWSGDLWWSQRTMYYAFGPDDPHLPGALRILAFHQTPEGLIHAAPYAENDTPPASGDYGLFASDEFSAWFVPVLWEHFLFTGDESLARELWPAADRDLRYLATRMGPDGLHEPHLETSKHAYKMDCGDLSKRAYQNLVFWMAWRDGARLARALGLDSRAAELETLARDHAAAIRRAFQTAGGPPTPSGEWNTVLGEKGGDPLSCAMLLGSGFLDDAEAAALVRERACDDNYGVGKFRVLALRGMFRHGLTEDALHEIDGGSWNDLADPAWPGAHCTTECTYLYSVGWWDESHPDTSITDVYPAYVLGVEPVEPGFRVFRAAPQPPPGLAWARGTVPTPHGDIEAAWTREGDALALSLSVPPGTRALLPDGRSLGPGRHTISCAPQATQG